jgi:hypothetical protein
MPSTDAGSLMVHAVRKEKGCAFDQLLLVATSCGQFSWETENVIRDEERRGRGKGNNQNKRGVRGVEGRRCIGSPVGIANPLR